MSEFDNLPSTDAEWLTLLERLDIETLYNLNRLVCDRLDYLNASDISLRMAEFRVGQEVAFTDKRGVRQVGRVIKHNRKTIKVGVLDGRKWNVSPMLLEPADSGDTGVGTSDVNAPATVPDTGNANATNELSTLNRIPGVDDWVGGYCKLPALVNEEAGTGHFQPSAFVWIDGNGMVRNVTILEPGETETPQSSLESFYQAVNEPAEGNAGLPRSVRFADKELINALAQEFSSVEFIFTTTPEIDEFLDSMTDAFSRDEPVETFANLSISSSVTADFFDATASLYGYKPWDTMPMESCLIGITIDALQLKNAVIVIMGQQQQHYGYLLFDSLEDYKRYTLVAQLDDVKRITELPAHRVVTYEQLKTIDTTLRKECMDNGWRLADPNAYPELFLPESGGIARLANQHDLCVLAAVARGIAHLLDKPSIIESSWHKGKPQSLTTQVATSTDDIEVRITLPALPKGKTAEALNIVERMTLLQQVSEELAFERYHKLSEQLSDAYTASPEYQMQTNPGASFSLIMEFAYNYLQIPVTELLPTDLEEILYEIIPRKVMVNATEADDIVEDAVGFFSFLQRTYQLESATECLEILDPKAKQRLRHALTDTTKFGMGKSMLTGHDAGLPGFDELDLPTVAAPKPLTPKQQKQRKNKRKNARKARKKSRS